jgi:hypothetical protein
MHLLFPLEKWSREPLVPQSAPRDPSLAFPSTTRGASTFAQGLAEGWMGTNSISLVDGVFIRGRGNVEIISNTNLYPVFASHINLDDDCDKKHPGGDVPHANIANIVWLETAQIYFLEINFSQTLHTI